MSFESNIKQWVGYDNQIKELNDKIKSLLVPGTLLVGQKTLQSKKRHGKGTRRRRTRRGRK